MNQNFERIYDAILKNIEENNSLPWNCPFIKEGLPHNHVTGNQYNGRNLLMLWCANYNRSGFLTYNQAKKLGGQVRKGEHGYPILYAQAGGMRVNEAGEEEYIRGCAKVYFVFNVSQIDNLPEIEREETGNNADVNKFIDAIPVSWELGKNPHYSPSHDTIGKPMMSDFQSEEDYYATVFHELVHWSGAESRLSRPQGTKQEHEKYSFEELVAELGSAFLRAQFKIDNPKNIDNSAAYIQGWLSVFRGNKDILFNAMKEAEKAVDYLMRLAVNNITAESSPEGVAA